MRTVASFDAEANEHPAPEKAHLFTRPLCPVNTSSRTICVCTHLYLFIYTHTYTHAYKRTHIICIYINSVFFAHANANEHPAPGKGAHFFTQPLHPVNTSSRTICTFVRPTQSILSVPLLAATFGEKKTITHRSAQICTNLTMHQSIVLFALLNMVKSLISD